MGRFFHDTIFKSPQKITQPSSKQFLTSNVHHHFRSLTVAPLPASQNDRDFQQQLHQVRFGSFTSNKLHLRIDSLFWGSHSYISSNDQLKQVTIREFHCSKEGGHSGIKTTIARVASSLNWPNLATSVKSFTKNCTICFQYKPDNTT